MRDFHVTPVAQPQLDPPTVVELLEFERDYGESPKKGVLTQARWGWRGIRFEQELQRALKTTEALEHDAELTYRLIRIRDSRTQTRASRTFRPTPNRSTT
jgi:hypothetical protein